MTGGESTPRTREAETGFGEAALLERIVFERLLADLSARFADVSSEAVVAEIEAALGQLVAFLGYDRCTFTEFVADGTLSILCSAAVGGLEPVPRGPFRGGLPWFLEELRAGRIVALSSIPDDLPPEATAEAEHCRRIGLRSHLSIPLRIGGRATGVLSFAGLRSGRAWPEALIGRLKIIGEVFASAVARARAEEEAQRLRGRLWHADRVARTGALTAAIAHEINEPLAAILSNAQAGLRYLDRRAMRPDEVRAILEAVVRDDKRAVETIRTIRALLRRDETGRARIDIAAALREVVQLLSGELRRQGIRVDTELATGCWVIADKAQIEQVAINLILNAAAAMQVRAREERFLRVSLSRSADARIITAVSDAGTGIAAEDIAAVFEPFWTTRREGLGLGLAISRSIVQAHGGAISVAANPDRGVTFRFELQGEASEHHPQQATRPAGEVMRENSKRTAAAGPTVCIVDDDAAVRESLARLLAASGCSVASYASALEFLERASLADVACVLLDNRMPGMSGLELQAHLSSRDTTPPVVFLTSDDDIATGVEAMKLGAVDFLVKPVDDEVLLAVVGKAFERHAGERKRTLEQEACRTRVGRLSGREREVMAHVIRGRLNKQIAADLDIAEQTVKQHRGRAMEKIGVRSVPELVRVCAASGLFPVPEPHATRTRGGRSSAAAPDGIGVAPK